MDQISFELLYSDDDFRALGTFLVWTNDFLEGMGVTKCRINQEKALEFVTNLRKEDFPASGGFEKASPFKKAANIYVWLHTLNPFIESLPTSIVGDLLAGHRHSTASLVGFALVQRCLLGAELKKNGEVVKIAKPINISLHFFRDLVEASDCLIPHTHFKLCSVLFESMVFEANPDLSYDKVFDIS